MDEQTYTVVGMTCDHCALSVREVVSAIVGVGTVEVDRPSGRLAVHGRDIPEAVVRAAVEGAGYVLAGKVQACDLRSAYGSLST